MKLWNEIKTNVFEWLTNRLLPEGATTGQVAVKQSDGTWSGAAVGVDESANYNWTGYHQFNGSYTISKDWDTAFSVSPIINGVPGSAYHFAAVNLSPVVNINRNGDYAYGVRFAPVFNLNGYTPGEYYGVKFDCSVALGSWKIPFSTESLSIGQDIGTAIYFTNHNNSGVGLKAGAGVNGTNRVIVNGNGQTWLIGLSALTNSTTPNVRAILDFSSINKGILIPRMTATQAETIASPPDSLLVFVNDVTTPGSTINSRGYWWYDLSNSSWTKL